MQGNLSLNERLEAFSLLGAFIAQYETQDSDPKLEKLNQFFWDGYQKAIHETSLYNGWFTKEQMHFALQAWSEQLRPENLQAWVKRYDADFFDADDKQVAIIMAGNIPLVGFHDFLSVLLSGKKVLVKPSTDDKIMIPFLAQMLVAIKRGFAEKIAFADGRMTGFDAVIATGSDNSSRYFEQYFGKYPHIIRKNRTSVAVLDGSEDEDTIKQLGEDVFRYFGMGCRNVTKLYLPKGFNIDRLFEGFFSYAPIGEHNKYNNNYEYHRAIYLMEQHTFLDNGFVMLKENEDLHAPVSVVYYSFYDRLDEVETLLKDKQAEIQCLVGRASFCDTDFGDAQKPTLWDYADKVDTLKFLRTV
jgi:hypothetical protein